jgi:Exopolysaccharide biosynthesis protein YbjH/Capsule biosynthesis GfcC
LYEVATLASITMTGLNYVRGFLIAMSCWMVWPCMAQQVTDAPIIPGERASDWLMRNVPLMGDTSAVHWLVAAEVRAQEQLRQAVLQAVSNRDVLTQFLSEMAPTGRLRLARSDPRWLQGAPNQDPVLQADQSMRRYERPRFVGVLTATGEVCRALHTPGALASDYLRACGAAGLADSVDFVWLAQPDGRTQRVGVALWSQSSQDQPAPGAWIWAPMRNSGIHGSVSENLIRFLATQPPLEYLPVGNKVASQTEKTVVPTQAAPRNGAISASDWGEIGLLQTPTARMATAGEFRFTWSKVQPYTRGTIMFQPLDWLEGGFRYTDISNRLYGPEIAGDQTYKDKSLDLKIRLVEESALRPQVAFGARDLGGTGLFAGEYVVANKRWGSWDASLGVGWGNLGTRADFAGSGIRQGITEASGGTANLKDMFKGPAALFGGVQWQVPNSAWLMKAEWDGNDYQHEAQNNNQTANSALNWGAVYRYSPNVDFNMGWERGNRLMLGLTIQADLKKYNVPKVFDPVLPPVLAMAPAELSPGGWKDAAHSLELFTGWNVQQITQNRDEVSVVIETDNVPYVQERIDKAISVLHKQAPANVTAFDLQLRDHGLVVSQVKVNRMEWMAQHTGPVPTALRLPTQQLTPGGCGEWL